MIAFVEGELWAREEGAAVVRVSGVGIRLRVSARTLAALPPAGQRVHLNTRLVVREDDLTLYGFTDVEEERLFALLTAASGVGPRTALAILSLYPPATVIQAIVSADVRLLTRVPGVGRKTAERMVLELRDRVGVEPEESSPPWAPVVADAVAALEGLGFSRADVREALRDVPAGLSVEAMVRHGLGRLSGQEVRAGGADR